MSDAPPIGWLPQVGDRVDRYEVVAEIARGGMAAVYAVRRRSIGGFGKLLAMKVLLPTLRDEREFVDMLLDEARLASAIHHPNVVQVFDLGEERGTPYLVMEFVHGSALSDLAKRARAGGEPIPVGVALQILSEVAEGLHAAHETRGSDGQPLGIIHRDVSPHNILVSYDGHTKVTDFGIAAGRGRLSRTRSGVVRGKLSYLAPEQVQRLHGVDRRIDVWGLGVVAWELLAGKRLFEGSDEAQVLWDIVGGELADLGAAAPEVPASIVQLVHACLSRDRNQRPATCREVAEAFGQAAHEVGCRGNADVERFVSDLCPDSRLRLEQRLSDLPTAESLSGTPTRAEAPAIASEQSGTDVGVSASLIGKRAPRWQRPLVAAALVLTGGAIALAFASGRAKEPEPAPAPAAIASAPSPTGSASASATASAPAASAAPAPSAPASAEPARKPIQPKRPGPLMSNPY